MGSITETHKGKKKEICSFAFVNILKWKIEKPKSTIATTKKIPHPFGLKYMYI